MSKAACPGQDTRYWKPDDIFNIQCDNCGKMIEFFKDDVSRKCPNCGARVQNPKISMGCAQWCKHAKECLGYDPKILDSNIDSTGDNLPVTEGVINSIKLKFGETSSIYKNAILSLEKAEEMLSKETADLKVVKTAVLLIKIDITTSDSIMKDVGLDRSTIDSVREIIEGYHQGNDIDSREFKIVTDAYRFIQKQ